MGKLDGKIDAVFADMDVPQHPGAALLVIDHDEIAYKKCYGLADLEVRRPVTPDTSFYLGRCAQWPLNPFHPRRNPGVIVPLFRPRNHLERSAKFIQYERK